MTDTPQSDRAVLFIDGNNWYHGLTDIGVSSLGDLDYGKISKKLVGAARIWIGTRYYIGALKHYHTSHKEQQRFLARLRSTDSRISVHLGRIEDQPKKNELAEELLRFAQKRVKTSGLRQELVQMAQRHKHVSLLKEKATDVLLAVDLCRLAREDEVDAIYLLSADGDYTPAVEFALALGKKVYAVSPTDCAALRNCATAYIPLRPDWFKDCYLY